MVLPCKFYNTEKGCRSDQEKCGHPHVRYCTNPLCEGAAAKTHSLETCGRKGGGAHEAFIAKKREVSMAEKAKKKAMEVAKPEASAPDPSTALEKAKHTLGDAVYKKALFVLTNNDSEGYNKVMEDFPLDLTAERLTGKIVGMLLEGLEFDELFKLATSPSTEELEEYMAHATDVLYKHAKEVAE
jgi:hypothetical protein